ncbi:hypothetical protein C900_02426 [Fulvivirga imtechensis AK7]|uniref:RNA-splicing ligase RtcB n=1 Tax=Fulvivirga imtechensis AK7 TaxID=1237149 RepID=L8JTP8_9BACT|nr:hypothetical protein [Fulvivirga imtechensis]ELR71618.1 hypothetical protein C900_02426 [Fulvivirga imtechensis AK7]
MELKDQLIKINDYLWELPKTVRKGMVVPAHVYASERLLAEIGNDKSLQQLTNVPRYRVFARLLWRCLMFMKVMVFRSEG